jgi:hypothetical protein
MEPAPNLVLIFVCTMSLLLAVGLIDWYFGD